MREREGERQRGKKRVRERGAGREGNKTLEGPEK